MQSNGLKRRKKTTRAFRPAPLPRAGNGARDKGLRHPGQGLSRSEFVCPLARGFYEPDRADARRRPLASEQTRSAAVRRALENDVVRTTSRRRNWRLERRDRRTGYKLLLDGGARFNALTR